VLGPVRQVLGGFQANPPRWGFSLPTSVATEVLILLPAADD